MRSAEAASETRKDGISPHGRATKMTSKREQSELEPKTAEQYRQAADAHAQTLKDFWKRFLVSGLFVVAAIIIIFACLAWFVSNNQVKAETATLSAKGVRYSITAEGAAKGAYDQDGYSTGQLDISDSMDVSVDSNFNNTDKSIANRLGPGSRGSITFYVQWLDGDPQNVDVDIVRSISVSTGDQKANIDTFENLLTGHVLFFKSRDENGYYSGWLGSTYTVTAEQLKAEKSKKVKCTLYWVWPELFRNFVYPGNQNYNQGIFATSQEDGYTGLLADVNANRSKYYIADTLSLIPEAKAGMSASDLQACTNAYNNADEMLGKSVNYFQIRLKATAQDEKSSTSEGEGE